MANGTSAAMLSSATPRSVATPRIITWTIRYRPGVRPSTVNGPGNDINSENALCIPASPVETNYKVAGVLSAAAIEISPEARNSGRFTSLKSATWVWPAASVTGSASANSVVPG